MTPRQSLVLYLAVLPLPTLIHDPLWLGTGLALALWLAGTTRWRIFRRSIGAVLTFNLAVSLGYVVVALWRNDFHPEWLLIANLRVLLMVYLGFWFITRTPLLPALAGWPTATLLATLALGQIKTFERLLHDCRDAFTSRNIAPPRLLDRRHQVGAQAVALLDKAQAQSQEVTLAMKSRGGFDA